MMNERYYLIIKEHEAPKPEKNILGPWVPPEERRRIKADGLLSMPEDQETDFELLSTLNSDDIREVGGVELCTFDLTEGLPANVKDLVQSEDTWAQLWKDQEGNETSQIGFVARREDPLPLPRVRPSRATAEAMLEDAANAGIVSLEEYIEGVQALSTVAAEQETAATELRKKIVERVIALITSDSTPIFKALDVEQFAQKYDLEEVPPTGIELTTEEEADIQAIIQEQNLGELAQALGVELVELENIGRKRLPKENRPQMRLLFHAANGNSPNATQFQRWHYPYPPIRSSLSAKQSKFILRNEVPKDISSRAKAILQRLTRAIDRDILCSETIGRDQSGEQISLSYWLYQVTRPMSLAETGLIYTVWKSELLKKGYRVVKECRCWNCASTITETPEEHGNCCPECGVDISRIYAKNYAVPVENDTGYHRLPPIILADTDPIHQEALEWVGEAVCEAVEGIREKSLCSRRARVASRRRRKK